ncbi:hypothetical protein [Alloalcanivorax balearicus]|uniref:hypothetical protein n=1 Tax=Alloalcanivorax balearicus TaxID=413232 RepID=UPI0021CD8E55|nr:hypothetical protein [Alloalcanivorax balearicus]
MFELKPNDRPIATANGSQVGKVALPPDHALPHRIHMGSNLAHSGLTSTLQTFSLVITQVMGLCQLANPPFISLFSFFAFFALDSCVFYGHTIMSIALMDVVTSAAAPRIQTTGELENAVH